MLYNYLKIAFRVFLKNKVYVSINLFNLSFALACFILAYLNFSYHNNFDRNFSKTENIFRLNSMRTIDGAKQQWGVAPAAAGEAIASKYPGIEAYARLASSGAVLKLKGNALREQMHYADAAFFSFFHFPLAEGNLNQFANRNGVVISKSLANKYFGSSTAVGKQIAVINGTGAEVLLTVTAVMKQVPLNSSFQIDLVRPFDQFPDVVSSGGGWSYTNPVATFFKLQGSAAVAGLEQQISGVAALHNQIRPDWKIDGFKLQRFSDIAYSSDIDMGNYVHNSTLQPNPRGVTVIVPAIMSLFILLITCFNFTNISIALAGKRLKEIGIRKVVGGRKIQLIKQFLIENLLQCVMAGITAILLVGYLLPSLNQLFGVALAVNLASDAGLWLIMLLLPVGTAVVAGLYPSFYITSFKPTSILKGETTFGPKSRFTRFLLLGQFVLTCLALIVGIILTDNAAYQQQVDFGYAIREVGVVEVQSEGQFVAIRNALANDSRVASVGGAAQQIASSSYTASVESEKNSVKAQVAHVGGASYLKTMGIELESGRHFLSVDGPDKDQAVMVNETMARSIGLADPVGKQIKLDDQYLTIIGVVKDYKEAGLHGLVPPCVLRLAPAAAYKYLAFRTKPEHLMAVYNDVQSAWRAIIPNVPFSGFLQTDLVEKERYLNEGFKSVAFFLAFVTILLSASGLFALVSLNILRRNKEVGVRKVLGAPVTSIIRLVAKDFVYLLLAGFVVGSALGYLIMHNIVFRFIYAYHSSIGPGSFVATLAILLSVCMLTVGYRIYAAAVMSPVTVLKKN